ncbi:MULTISPECIES: hypothetical protein [Methylomonas]|uniref:hypothetical protein n=1 Tax=Methylomonas TaxID=416 RepID=UPI00123248EE|nr:hypothetical protein [Methylomonas rhizoryzae]
MKRLMLFLIIVSTVAAADGNRTSSGTLYSDDGTSYIRMGNTVYGSDGSTGTAIGSSIYHDDGSTSIRIGNTAVGTGRSSGPADSGADGNACRQTGKPADCD